MATQSIQPNISALDRLGFTVFMAVALHAIVVLTDFIQEDPEPAPLTLEITLAQYDDGDKPKKADFLAQSNQEGSGEQEEKSEITVTEPSIEQSVLEQELVSQQMSQTEITPQPEQNLISSVSDASRKALTVQPDNEPLEFVEPQVEKSFLNSNINWQIEQLEATLDDQVKNYYKKPRVTRLTASSTMKSEDANYVRSVVERIEKIGKLNFPQEASGKKLYGKPMLSIRIYSDGTLESVEVRKSSGNLVLDSKTIEIVYRSAPFAPFPKDVRKTRDVLQLIRTFSYSNKGVRSF